MSEAETPASPLKVNGPLAGAVRPGDKPQVGYAQQASSEDASAQAPERVRMYVDGFNLYYGLHDASGRRYLWLDLAALGRSFLRPNQQLDKVYYFTARRRNDVTAQANQATYLRALKATGVTVIEGRFQAKTQTCRSCQAAFTRYEEKESDVSFCVQLVEDAAKKLFDVAFLVTADSDMIPAVVSAKRLSPDARFLALSPPRRRSSELQRYIPTTRISDQKIRQAQLPNPTFDAAAVPLSRPGYWN